MSSMHLLHLSPAATVSRKQTPPPLLPPTKTPFRQRNRLNILPSRRYIRLLMLLLVGLSALFWVQSAMFVSDDIHILHRHRHHRHHQHALYNTDDDHNREQPSFEEYDAAERGLPQHTDALPFPEGNHAKYIYFSNHQKGVGWGNFMQEMIFNAHLAFVLKRSFVFYNFTDYWEENGHQVVSRIPLSAIISGPIIGGPMNPYNDTIPRAISSEYFKRVCPDPTIIDTRQIKSELGSSAKTGAATIMQTFTNRLGGAEFQNVRCIQIGVHTPQIFDYLLFGSKSILDIWPSLSQSHILRSFSWSELVLDSYRTNRAVFDPPRQRHRLGIFDWVIPEDASSTGSSADNSPIPGLLVIHLRRGDFETHCRHFAKWSSSFNGFNAFSSFPDQFSPPPLPPLGRENTSEEIFQIYQNHCYPTVQTIVERVRKVRAQAVGLRRLYIMTNAKRDWLHQLKLAFTTNDEGGDGDDEWDLVATSRDLELDWEQGYVSQGLDMYVAVRAQVFIGNGFSSLSSNVAMLRMANNVDPRNTRFL